MAPVRVGHEEGLAIDEEQCHSDSGRSVSLSLYRVISDNLCTDFLLEKTTFLDSKTVLAQMQK